MTSKEKKLMKIQQIKLGKTSKRERSHVWEYILKNNLGIGYYDAQQLSKKGIKILKHYYDSERPD